MPSIIIEALPILIERPLGHACTLRDLDRLHVRQRPSAFAADHSCASLNEPFTCDLTVCHRKTSLRVKGSCAQRSDHSCRCWEPGGEYLERRSTFGMIGQ